MSMIAPAIPAKVSAGDRVSVDYTGWLENGRIFDTTRATVARRAGIQDPDRRYVPIPFVVGSGAMIRGFEEAVIGMAEGQSLHVRLEPEQAYGEYDPSFVKPVPIEAFEKAGIMPHTGQTLYFHGLPVRIDRIVFNGADLSNSTVYVDFNHPLASRTLHYMITVGTIATAKRP